MQVPENVKIATETCNGTTWRTTRPIFNYNVTCYTIYQKRGKAEERQNVKLVLALLPDTCTLKAVYWINYVSISISESLE